MIFVNFFRLLFLFIIGYLIYSLLKFLFAVVRRSLGPKAGDTRFQDRTDRVREDRKKSRKGGKVIELDKDQYKVE